MSPHLRPSGLVLIILFLIHRRVVFCANTEEKHTEVIGKAHEENFQLIEGVDLNVKNDSSMMLNLNLGQIKESFEGRRKSGGGGGDKKLLRRILPLFIMPFLIQSAIIPMFLSTLKMMLVKSMMVGKLALLLIAFNAFRTSNAFKSRGDERLADSHYGYHGSGMEEYGAYVNGRHMKLT